MNERFADVETRETLNEFWYQIKFAQFSESS